MKFITNYFKDWTTFEKVWLIAVCSIMITVWFVNGDTWFMLALTITGSLNLVLGAKGKLEGLYFAIINSVLYSIQCFDIKLYGEVTYNILFSIPVSIAALYLWNKHKDKGGEVQFNTMNLKKIVLTIFVTLVGIVGYSYILTSMGGNFAFMDSLTTVVSVVASILYMYRFSEQWLMWIVVNALSMAMWIMVLVSGDSSVLLIIVMNCINLLNSCYGYYNWKCIAKKSA